MACALLLIGFFGWAANAAIISAVVALGVVDVDPNRHPVQHPEGGVVAEIHVSEGHDEYSGFATVGSLGLRQFQGSIEIPATQSFQLNRLFLTLADDTGNENGPSVTVPVLFGPRILPGYGGWRPYTVQAGDTLTAIAQAQYGNGDFTPILEANQHVLADPNLIFPGQVLRIPRNDL